MPSETVWGIYMLNGLVDIGSKVVFYKNIFQSGSEDLEKDKVCQCKLHKVLNNSEITVIDDDDGKTELMKHECYTIDFYSKDKIFRCNAYFISDYNEDGYRYFNLEIISPLGRCRGVITRDIHAMHFFRILFYKKHKYMIL